MDIGYKIIRTWAGRPVKRERIDGVIEKRCPKCDSWKPHDQYHYYFMKCRGMFKNECRKCETARQSVARTA